MTVREILPEMSAGCMLLRPHVAKFLRQAKADTLRADTPAIRLASRRGVITLTITA
jgi:hypothetical protein